MWLLKSDEPVSALKSLHSTGKLGENQQNMQKTSLCFPVSNIGHVSPAVLDSRNQQTAEGPHRAARISPAHCSLWWASRGCWKGDTSSLEIPNGRQGSWGTAVFCRVGAVVFLPEQCYQCTCTMLLASSEPGFMGLKRSWNCLIFFNKFPFYLN